MERLSTRIWRPKTTYILIGGLVLLLIALVASYIVSNFKPTTDFRVGSGVYHLWIADNEARRIQGLSGVEKLAPYEGLLMKFDDDGLWGIWMKDMHVPLDILWIDKDKTVVHIVKNADPKLSTDTVFTPKRPARYVVELPAGSVDKAAIQIGGVVLFDETATGDFW